MRLVTRRVPVQHKPQDGLSDVLSKVDGFVGASSRDLAPARRLRARSQNRQRNDDAHKDEA
jgi:hypothetical protein